MRNHGVIIATLQLLALGSAQEHQFFRWNTPRALAESEPGHVRRQTPPGYHPEFGTCGSGTTCEDACGQNWISCQASTDLSLFCYNKVDLGQTCCENGSGRACERGYYCAWQEFGGRVWCCEDGQSLEECGVPQGGTSAATSATTGSGGPSSSSTAGDSTTSGTGTASDTSPTGSQCPASTVTSWGTTTIVSTVSVAAITVTVTEPGAGCSLTVSASDGQSHTSGGWHTSEPGTITDTPSSPVSSFTPWNPNATTTSTLVTAGAGGLVASHMALALSMIVLLLLWP